MCAGYVTTLYQLHTLLPPNGMRYDTQDLTEMLRTRLKIHSGQFGIVSPH